MLRSKQSVHLSFRVHRLRAALPMAVRLQRYYKSVAPCPNLGTAVRKYSFGIWSLTVISILLQILTNWQYIPALAAPYRFS